LVVAVAALGLVAVSPARAAVVRVGAPLIGSYSQTSWGGGPDTWANTGLESPGAHVTSPVDGVVIRWRMTGAFSGGPFRLRILHPVGGGEYAGAGTSSPQTPIGAPATNTFATHLPIEAGDLIGLDPEHVTDKIGSFERELASVTVSYWDPQLFDGAGALGPTVVLSPGYLLGFNADVLPLPGVTGIRPPLGSVTGGTTVRISGYNFAEVEGVSFGSTPAVSFTVSREGSIKAVAPASSSIASVPITVTTLAGSASSSSPFVYSGCRVPRLKGKKLKAARAALERANCGLGTPTRKKGVAAKAATVKKQSPKPGTILAPRTKVKVTLG
jgi:hypothetical protein